MKNSTLLLNKISYWVIPPGIRENAEKIYRSYKVNKAISSELKENFLQNKKFLDIHKDKRCFILATGPSINKQNLLPLKNEFCISVSNFFLHPSAKEICPLYHAFSPNHIPHNFDMIQKEMTIVKERSSEKTTFFFGYTPYEYSYKKFLDQHLQYKPASCYYINYSSSDPITDSNYDDPQNWDITKQPFSVRSVLYTAIQIAVYMGFTKIYLLGADHDYLNEVSQKEGDQHFYPQNQSPISTQEFYSNKEEIFLGYYYRWVQYRLMRKYLENKGIHIYNATEGGMLDVFPCIRLADIISEHNNTEKN